MVLWSWYSNTIKFYEAIIMPYKVAGKDTTFLFPSTSVQIIYYNDKNNYGNNYHGEEQ